MTLLLIHGAWHGGWCWERIVPLLESENITVYAPSLIGQGERAHEVTRETGLFTHIDQVVGMIKKNNLTDVVLVGHSYGGMVISGVAEKVPGLIKRLVYLDALVPTDGQCEYDMASEDSRKHDDDNAIDGWLNAPAEPEVMGVVDPNDIIWVRQNLVPIPQKCFTERLPMKSVEAKKIPRTYIQTSGFDSISAMAQRSESLGWDVYRMDPSAGHDAMVTRPKELSELLLRCVAES